MPKIYRHLTYQTVATDNGRSLQATRSLLPILKLTPLLSSHTKSGFNEHTNGLVRQYLPKSACLKSVTDQEVDQIETMINNRPRKILNYQIPKEVFFEMALLPPC